MIKQEFSELRRALGYERLVVRRIFHMYVSNENDVIWEAEDDFQMLEEERQNRIRDILKELLSTAVTVKTHPAEVEQNPLLYGILTETAEFEGDWKGDSEGGSENEAAETPLAWLKKTVLEGYPHTDPYYALAAEIIYDVPGKAEDHEEMFDASDETYTAMLAAVCPAKLSKAALGYADQAVEQLERRWEIGRPAAGFLYPSFRDRATDLSEAVFYTKDPRNETVLYRIFEVREEDIPETKAEKKENLAELLSDAELSIEEAAVVTESIQEMAEEDPEATLGRNEILQILQDSAKIDAKAMTEICEERIAQEIPVTVAAEKKIRIKTESCEVNISTDHAELIREEVIDGVRYICVPADGLITVNGIATVNKTAVCGGAADGSGYGGTDDGNGEEEE